MRKTVFLFFFLFSSVLFYAQAPQGINYQGVARDTYGKAISIHAIGVRFKIFQGPNPVYIETQSTTTDTFGLYSLVIGKGTASMGTFSSIPWNVGGYSIEVDIDPTGGTSYMTIATSVLQSVPYALFAATSGSTGVTNVTALSPLSVINSNTTPALSIRKAGPATSGYLDSTDWNLFNSKGNGTMTSITNGTGILFNGSQAVSTITNSVTITADNTHALWNANQLTGWGIATTPPLTGQVLQFNGSNWTPGNVGAGTVTSVSLTAGNTFTVNGSPVTNAGNLHFDFLPQSNGLVLAGPPTAGNAIPTFRGLLAADLAGGALNGQVLSTNGTTFNWINPPSSLPAGSNGQVLFYNGGWIGSNINNLFFNGTNVGIGTSTPGAALDISSTGRGISVTTATSTATSALNVNQAGNGQAGYFQISNTSTTSDAIYAQTNSTNGQSNAVKGYTNSGGNGVMGWNDNQANGVGSGIYGYSTGMGSAAAFVLSYTAATNPAIKVTNSGLGYSAIFTGGKGLQTDLFQMTSGPVAGYVLTSDAMGYGYWQPAPTSTVSTASPLLGNGSGSSPITLPLANANIFVGNGNAVGVPMSGDVSIIPSGSTTVNGLFGTPMVITSLVSGQILQFNGTHWINTTSGVLNGGTVNYIPKWTSSTGLSTTSLIYDNGTSVGINTTTPGAVLDVAPSGTLNLVQAINNGTSGYAGNFQTTFTGNNSPTFNVNNTGSSFAATIGTNNGANNSAALLVTTIGGGPALQSVTTGTADATVSHINNNANPGNALLATTNGTGSAGNFQITNNTSAGTTLLSTTNGSGNSAQFAGGAGVLMDKLQITGGATQGAVLVSTNAFGNATWEAICNFSASGSTTANIPVGTVTPIAFQTTDYTNPAGAFGGTQFTAPGAGLYHFDGEVTLNVTTGLSSPGDYQLQLMHNGGTYRVSYEIRPTGFAGPIQNRISLDIFLNAGDNVQLAVYHGLNNPVGVYAAPNYTFFTGHKVK